MRGDGWYSANIGLGGEVGSRSGSGYFPSPFTFMDVDVVPFRDAGVGSKACVGEHIEVEDVLLMGYRRSGRWQDSGNGGQGVQCQDIELADRLKIEDGD